MPPSKLGRLIIDEVEPQLARPGKVVAPVVPVALEVDATVPEAVHDPLASAQRPVVGPVEAGERALSFGLAIPVRTVLLALEDQLAGGIANPVAVRRRQPDPHHVILDRLDRVHVGEEVECGRINVVPVNGVGEDDIAGSESLFVMPAYVVAERVLDLGAIAIPLPFRRQPRLGLHRDAVDPDERLEVTGRDLEVLFEAGRVEIEVAAANPNHGEHTAAIGSRVVPGALVANHAQLADHLRRRRRDRCRFNWRPRWRTYGRSDGTGSGARVWRSWSRLLATRPKAERCRKSRSAHSGH